MRGGGALPCVCTQGDLSQRGAARFSLMNVARSLATPGIPRFRRLSPRLCSVTVLHTQRRSVLSTSRGIPLGLEGHSWVVTSVAWSPKLKGHSRQVMSVAWSPRAPRHTRHTARVPFQLRNFAARGRIPDDHSIVIRPRCDLGAVRAPSNTGHNFRVPF